MRLARQSPEPVLQTASCAPLALTARSAGRGRCCFLPQFPALPALSTAGPATQAAAAFPARPWTSGS